MNRATKTATQFLSYRSYVPKDLEIKSFEDVSSFFEDLETRNLESLEDLHAWLKDKSELEQVMIDFASWHMINFSCDNSEENLTALKKYQEEVNPKFDSALQKLNQLLISHPLTEQLTAPEYKVYIRNLKGHTEIYREENLELMAKDKGLGSDYSKIFGSLGITLNGEEFTLQQADKFYLSENREERKAVHEKLCAIWLEKADEFDNILDEMISLRHQVAQNAGLSSYKDFAFKTKNRFDYSPQDARNFHDAIAKVVVPKMRKIDENRLAASGLEQLKPYDILVALPGESKLEPFSGAEELWKKSAAVLSKVESPFGEYILEMGEIGHLDLDSRKGKNPGGYNCPLYESGIPFIFMNSAGVHRDIVTMFHEAGHAAHNYLSRDLDLRAFKRYPHEIAEVASMAMELLTMEHWDEFYQDPKVLVQAKQKQLERVMGIFPRIALSDHFQHVLYDQPNLSKAERREAFSDLQKNYKTGVVDNSGYEQMEPIRFHKVLHIFRTPFYMIEYAIAQLGAIAIWRNYKQDKTKALEQYKYALSLGNTRTLPELFEAAGVKFDFSEAYVQELIDFVWEEYLDLEGSADVEAKAEFSA